MFLLKILVLFLLNLRSFESARILGIFTVPSKSHTILAYELFKELANSGHEIVVIQPEGNELKNPPANYTNIIVGGKIIEVFNAHMNKAFDEVDVNPAVKFKEMLNLTAQAVEFTIQHPEVQSLLHSDDTKFDLVISEIAINEALLGFSEHFKCPHILLSTVSATSWIETLTSNPAPSSYIPHVFLDLTEKMNFLDRLQNTIFNIVEAFLFHIFHYPRQKEIYENAFPNSQKFRPFWQKVRKGVSMILMNSHYTVNYPRPFLPNLIEVGGMHIKKKVKPLPADIQKFIDESDGVVYFSLGGNLKPSEMPIEKQQAIINALSKVKKERILWKWDDESAKVDKKKFLVRKWFPQDDILAHSKVKVFVTHGGLLGGTEAIYNAKPLVTIPIFGDQKLNAARSEMSGIGVRVDYNNLTESSLSWALSEVLENRKYTDRARELSWRFRDKPQHPLDVAKFYVEYVIRHKGAPFMQTSAVHLNFVELYNIDVILIVILFIGIILILPFLIVKKILKVIFGSGAEKAKVENKKKKKN